MRLRGSWMPAMEEVRVWGTAIRQVKCLYCESAVTNQALTAPGYQLVSSRPGRHSCESQHVTSARIIAILVSLSAYITLIYLFCTLQMPCRTVPRYQILLQLQWTGTQGIQKTTGCATGWHWEPREWEDCLVYVPFSMKLGCNCIWDVTRARDMSESAPAEINACLNILALSTSVSRTLVI